MKGKRMKKKFLILAAVAAATMVLFSACEKEKKNAAPATETTTTTDNKTVVATTDVKAAALNVEHVVATDKQTMYTQFNKDYRYFETQITLKNFMDGENASAEVAEINNVFQVVDMTEDQIRQNLNLTINFLVTLLKKGWNNIKSLYIKTTMGKPVALF